MRNSEMTRPCEKEEKIKDIDDELDKISFKFTVFMGMIAVFMLLVATAVARSEVAIKEARDASSKVSEQETKMAVLEEKLDWLKQATLRIENKLDSLSGGKK